jgi:hypothetical protein
MLILTSQYILSLVRFLSSNLEIYKFNTSVHNINTRHKLKLHKPATRLTTHQRSVDCNSINVYNKLPDDLLHFTHSLMNAILFLSSALYLTSITLDFKLHYVSESTVTSIGIVTPL